MKNIVIRIIISIVVILVISACAKKEESTTTDPFACTGSSSGSGPTIGDVTLKEATYKLETYSFSFVNSTSAYIKLGETSVCYTIDATSTSASIYKTNSANTGNATIGGQAYPSYDNVTAYYMKVKRDVDSTTWHMYIYAETDSSFYINQLGFDSKAKSDAYPYLRGSAYTKQ